MQIGQHRSAGVAAADDDCHTENKIIKELLKKSIL
jgi:hypothetical protein